MCETVGEGRRPTVSSHLAATHSLRPGLGYERMFATSSDWDEGLDDAQLAAVSHGSTPLLVVAGAGTGKTRVLTARVARLLERGVEPERILLLTFTRRAADDMLSRAAALVGRPDLARRLRGGTFHHVAYQVIRSRSQLLGLRPSFSVLDPADAADTMDLLRDEFGLAGSHERLPTPRTLVELYSRCVNTARSLSEVIALDFPWCEPHGERIGELYRGYVVRKRARDQLDYDDLLLYWRAALREEATGAELADTWDHVLVDEYQDVNALQVEIVSGLCPAGRGLTAVGDEAQAIYGFRGADPAHLSALATRYPDMTVVGLEHNFRSVQPVLDLANRARPQEGAGLPRIELYAERSGGARPALYRSYDASSEARTVVDRILDLHEDGLRLADQAVLVRAAHHSDLIELELTARRVPYRKYGGLRFVDAAHLKDFVAVGRLLDNPSDDVAWLRLLRLHAGVGPARARRLLDLLPPRSPDGVDDWPEVVAAAPAAARVALSATLSGLLDARAVTSAPERTERLLAIVRPLVAEHYTSSAPRLSDLDRLAAAAAVSEDLGAWIAAITLDPPISSADLAGPPRLDEDYVVVSTVHAAKGLEWRAVHLVHLVEGAFPVDMALRSADGLAEERRLFYVALTRARDELHLYSPQRLPHHRRGGDARHTLVQSSRFLDPTLLSLLSIHDEPAARGRMLEAASGGASGKSEPRAVVAAALDLDSLWR